MSYVVVVVNPITALTRLPHVQQHRACSARSSHATSNLSLCPTLLLLLLFVTHIAALTRLEYVTQRAADILENRVDKGLKAISRVPLTNLPQQGCMSLDAFVMAQVHIAD